MSGSALGSTAPSRLVLASGSLRRVELLGALGLVFEVRAPEVDETPHPGEAADTYVLRLAEAKAHAVAQDGELVLAADTVVVVDERLLGKPQDDADARRMLSLLAGCTHQVLTGLAVIDRARRLCLLRVERTAVRFAELTLQEIDRYVASGEPRGKAGAYAIQGLGALFIDSISGSYSNVVGLPLAAVYQLLKAAGLDVLERATLELSRRT